MQPPHEMDHDMESREMAEHASGKKKRAEQSDSNGDKEPHLVEGQFIQ